MGKLVEHEVDVVALRSFRPKDYADVGCSQEDSALITQAIRANPSPAARRTRRSRRSSWLRSGQCAAPRDCGRDGKSAG